MFLEKLSWCNISDTTTEDNHSPPVLPTTHVNLSALGSHASCNHIFHASKRKLVFYFLLLFFFISAPVHRCLFFPFFPLFLFFLSFVCKGILPLTSKSDYRQGMIKLIDRGYFQPPPFVHSHAFSSVPYLPYLSLRGGLTTFVLILFLVVS